MFVPLSHGPGHAQCDFGEALAVIAGVECKVHYFVLDLPHSDGCFAKAYPGETTEAFLDGHVAAFAFLGGVPQSILYDNTKLAVAKILCYGRRKRTRAFTELQSHYLFEDLHRLPEGQLSRGEFPSGRRFTVVVLDSRSLGDGVGLEVGQVTQLGLTEAMVAQALHDAADFWRGSQGAMSGAQRVGAAPAGWA